MLASNQTFIAWASAIAILAATPAIAVAQRVDRATTFSFSQPVALPGVTLSPGQYLFRLAEPMGSGRVVQVLSADGHTPYALLATRSIDRPEPAGAPDVRFMETAPGMPAAVQAWWYPGEREGFEFVYPDQQARLLARGVGERELAARPLDIAALATPPAVGTRQ